MSFVLIKTSIAGVLVSASIAWAPAAYAQLYNESQTREIAAIIVTAACAAQAGLIPRSKTGQTIKEMLASKGFSAQRVYNNWDYYWRNAKFYSSQTGMNCIK